VASMRVLLCAAMLALLPVRPFGLSFWPWGSDTGATGRSSPGAAGASDGQGLIGFEGMASTSSSRGGLTDAQRTKYGWLLQDEKALSTGRFPRCWREAVRALQAACSEMEGDTSMKQRLALGLANCHLQDASRRTYPCGAREDTRDCLRRLNDDDVALGVYTEFFFFAGG
jgi:hypothetical protein